MHAEGSESIGVQINAPVGFSNNIPYWLDRLFKAKFFGPCLAQSHQQFKRKEKNIFCLDCYISFCNNCSQNHFGHRILQIRKYNCHEVVKTEDMDKVISCSLVQTYNLNRAHVVFLRAHPNKKDESIEADIQLEPNSKKKKKGELSESRICYSCPCTVRDLNKYCSISCKVKHLLRTEGSIVRQLRQYALHQKPLNQESDKGPSADHILRASASANSTGSKGKCIESVDLSKEKKNNGEPSLSLMRVHRRKGVPMRSPLH